MSSNPVIIENVLINTSSVLNTNQPQDANPLTLQIKTPIILGDDKYAIVSLKSFTSTNLFNNISAKTNTNTLKVVTLYTDYSSGSPVSKSELIKVTVPDGHYSIVTLLSYLNGACNSSVLQGSYDATAGVWYDSSGNVTTTTQDYFTYSQLSNPYISSNTHAMYFTYRYYGIGFNGLSNFPEYPGGTVDTSSNPTSLAFVLNTDASKVILNPVTPNNVYYHNYFSGSVASSDPFVVTGTVLVYDDETRNLMDILGFKYDQTVPYNGTSFTNIINAGDRVIGWYPPNKPQNNTTGLYAAWNPTYTLNAITAGKALNLGTPSVLNMVINEVTLKGHGNILETDRNNILATIPVTSAFGGFISYTPANPTKYRIEGPYNFTQLTVTFYDETYDTPSFDGIDWQAIIEFSVYIKSQDATEDFDNRQKSNIETSTARTRLDNAVRNQPNPFSHGAASAALSKTVIPRDLTGQRFPRQARF